MGFFSALFGSKKPKKVRIIDDLQVEIVHRSPFGQETDKLMDLKTFSEASKYFEQAKKAHFIGWGDPLDHPQVFEMLKTAKENSAQVEITTLGSKLNPTTVTELINIDLDTINIIFNYPEITLDSVNENIKNLVKQKGKYTKVIIEFVMTKDSIGELPNFTELAGELNVDEIRASNLNFILSPESNTKKVFEGTITDTNRGDLIKQGQAKGKEEYETLIKEAEKAANRKGVYFSARPLVANESVMCEYSPLKSVFINWEGLMAPCQYLALKNAQGFFNNQQYKQDSFIVGNINDTNFLELWNDKKYVDFRKIYKKRVQIFNVYMEETFEDEPNAKLIFENYQRLDQQLAEEKMPEVCSKCYKGYSI